MKIRSQVITVTVDRDQLRVTCGWYSNNPLFTFATKNTPSARSSYAIGRWVQVDVRPERSR